MSSDGCLNEESLDFINSALMSLASDSIVSLSCSVLHQSTYFRNEHPFLIQLRIQTIDMLLQLSILSLQ